MGKPGDFPNGIPNEKLLDGETFSMRFPSRKRLPMPDLQQSETWHNYISVPDYDFAFSRLPPAPPNGMI